VRVWGARLSNASVVEPRRCDCAHLREARIRRAHVRHVGRIWSSRVACTVASVHTHVGGLWASSTCEKCRVRRVHARLARRRKRQVRVSYIASECACVSLRVRCVDKKHTC
jgi:hypothetical protein